LIRLVETIPAPIDRVWAELSDLGSHAEWMADAAQVDFEGGPQSGPGARMKVATSIGPFRVTDSMTVVEWIERSSIVVEHTGSVSGTGRFDLAPDPVGTMLTWTEDLVFPWWLGGRLGAWVATPIMKKVWRSSLSELSARVLSAP
jgi:carbon monoxide dehydrogenase subunit G